MSKDIDMHLLNTVASLLNNVSSLVFWICTADYSHQFSISQGFEDIWGRSIQWQLSHASEWFNTLVVEDLENNLAEFQNRSNTLGQSIIKMRVIRPDGDLRYLKNSSITLPDASGKPTIIVGTDELVCPNQWYEMNNADEVDSFKPCVLTDLFENLQKNIELISHTTIASLPKPSHENQTIHLDGHTFFLTKREKQCINYLLCGLSAKQTASRLNISQRTVEIYLDNIKKKTNSRTKLILLSKLQKVINE